MKPGQTYNSATSERSQRYRLTNLEADSVYECLVQTKNQHGYGELSDLHQWFTSPKGRVIVHGNSNRRQSDKVLIVICVLALVLNINK